MPRAIYFSKHSLRSQVAQSTLDFERDYYLCTKEEMWEKWLDNRDAKPVLPYLGLDDRLRVALQGEFIDHLPFWEYVWKFGFSGEELDPSTGRPIPCNEFRLYPPLHREIICKKIQGHVLAKTQERAGLAIFITRFGLKTGIGCYSLASWLLTRHRVLFNDHTTIRIIHDVKDEAIKRASEIKKMHTHNKELRGIYPEVMLPAKHGAAQFWNLPDRDESGRFGLDFQIGALGVKSAKQGLHPMYTIIDDVESERHAYSPAAVEETKNFFKGFQYSEQLGLSRTVLLGTFYHPSSVHAAIYENWELAEKGEMDPRATWEVVCIPAAYNYDDDQKRELTYPLRLSYEELEARRIREVAEHGNDLNWHMQILLDFRSSNVYMFDMERWQGIDLERPATEAALRVVEALSNAPTFILADLAGKDESTRGRGNYNAIWVVQYPRIDGQIHRVLVDAHHDNVNDVTESAKVLLSLAHSYDAWYIVAEESPAHRFIGKAITDEAAAMGLRYFQSLSPSGKQAGNVITLVPRRGAAAAIADISSWKMARINKFQAAWNVGRVWVNTAIPGEIVAPFRTQIGAFPFIKMDDLIDSVSLADDERVDYLIPQPRVHSNPRRLAGKRHDFVQMGRHTGLCLPRR